MEDIRNSKFLATIVTDVPIELDLDAMKRREPNKEKLKNIFEACEFRTFIQRFLGESPNAKTNAGEEPDLFAPQGAENGAESGNLSTNYPQSSHKTLQDTEHNYVLIDNLKDASALCGNLLTFPVVAFDTETTGIDAMSAEMVGMSSPLRADARGTSPFPENQAEAQEFVDAFRPFFENEGQIKVGQNLKYASHHSSPLRRRGEGRALRHHAGALCRGTRAAPQHGLPRRDLPPLPHHPH